MKSTYQKNSLNSYKFILAFLFAGVLFVTSTSQTLAAIPSPVGVWNLAGIDEANNKWIASLVLFHNTNNVIVGYADWSSNNRHGGREYVTATL